MEKNRIRPMKVGKGVRMSYSKQKEVLEMPNLIEIQKDSYQWSREVFNKIFLYNPFYIFFMQNISFSILIPVVIFLGICAAAFFNRLIRRMPFDISLRIKETCPHCKKPVPVLFQIPFLGILFTRFRYACCDSKISKKSLLVDFSTLLTVILALVLWYVFYSEGMPLSLETLFPFLVLLWLMISLVPIFVIDFRYHLLPDSISIGGIEVGIILSSLLSLVIGKDSIKWALVMHHLF